MGRDMAESSCLNSTVIQSVSRSVEFVYVYKDVCNVVCNSLIFFVESVYRLLFWNMPRDRASELFNFTSHAVLEAQEAA